MQTVKVEEAKVGLTPESAKLFAAIVADAPNWSGTPPCYNHITSATRGNLTQLKRKGLVTTFKSDGEEWITITEAGRNFAALTTGQEGGAK